MVGQTDTVVVVASFKRHGLHGNRIQQTETLNPYGKQRRHGMATMDRSGAFCDLPQPTLHFYACII